MNFKKISFLVASAFASTFYYPAMGITITINNGQHETINDSKDLGVAGTMIVGSGTNGALTVTTGGTLTTNLFSIGRNGASGQVDVVNGGVINIANSNNFSYPLAVGGTGGSGNTSQGSVATLNISGSGSQVLVSDMGGSDGELSVGSAGAQGYLNVTDGGKLTINKGEFFIGSRGSTTTQGTVTVDGAGSEIYAKKRVLVGTYNDGRLIVSNGGTFQTDDYISVGRTADTKTADSMLIVTGNGSVAKAAKETQIGWLGKGTVVVADGGKLSTSQVIIANDAAATGELAIGSRTGEAPVAAGVIDTASVKFGAGNSTLVFNHTDTNYQFAPVISGNGRVNVLSGTTVLTGANTYSGVTSVSGGATLQAGAINSLSASSGIVVDAAGQLDLGGYDQTVVSLNNGGTVTFNKNHTSGRNHSVFTVTGDYTGNHGTIVFDTALGDDTSLSDKLVINGNATGSTNVRVNNLGGLGNETIEGIQLIQVNGNSDNDTFVQDGRIVAGLYDYTLTKGNASGTDSKNWFLQSDENAQPGGNIRPEAGGYLGVIEFTQDTFKHSFHDRQQFLENGYNSTWSRVDYTRGRSNVGQGAYQLTNKTDRTLIQLGSDIYQNGSFHLGTMLGYSKGHVKTDAVAVNATGIRHTDSHSDGYSAGMYATWLNQSENRAGSYVDTYVQYNYFNNTLKGNTLATEEFNNSNINASLEAGYGFALGGSSGSADWMIQPQAQILYYHHDGKNHTEQNGTRVQSRNANDYSGRIGIRLQGTGTKAQVFATANYWTHSDNASISMNEVNIQSERARQIAELKIGTQVALNKKVALFGQIHGSAGSDSTTNYGGSVGIKYQWK